MPIGKNFRPTETGVFAHIITPKKIVVEITRANDDVYHYEMICDSIYWESGNRDTVREAVQRCAQLLREFSNKHSQHTNDGYGYEDKADY
jgi:hypothetical protein